MKELVLVLDYQTVTMQIVKEVVAERYDVESAEDTSGIQYKHYDAILVHLSDLDKDWNIRALKNWSDSIPILAYTETNNSFVEEAVNQFKVASVIYTPFNPTVLLNTIANVIELYNYRQRLEAELVLRTHDLKESHKQLDSNLEFVITALGSVIESRDAESGNHVQRVAKLTEIILERVLADMPIYSITKHQIKTISSAAIIHDLGKIAIPDAILNKPGRLTFEEFEEMKKHTLYGCDLLEKFKQPDMEGNEFYQYCYDICRWHHERYDGKGYPDGLVGEHIPIWSQVVAIADVIDALTSKRAYKEPYDINTAFDMINNGECGKFSNQLLDAVNKSKLLIEDTIERLRG